MRSVHWVFLWRTAFGHVGFAYRHSMIRGVLAVVKGGFREYVEGDSRLRGNDGRGAGYDGRGMGERKDARTQ